MPESAEGGSDTTVVALAIQISNLRQDLKSIVARLDALTAEQREHATALQAVATLRNRVEASLTYLDETDKASPASWFWLTMTKQERQEKFDELADWVETVLRVQYPSYLADHLRPCWPNHPEALWELSWLYQLWTRAYLVKRPTPKDAADWHDRWLPGTIRRLSTVMHPCERACRDQPARPEMHLM